MVLAHANHLALVRSLRTAETETSIVRMDENDLTGNATNVETETMATTVDIGETTENATNVLPPGRHGRGVGIIGSLLLTGDGPRRKSVKVVISEALGGRGAQMTVENVMTGKTAKGSGRRRRSPHGWRLMSQVSLSPASLAVHPPESWMGSRRGRRE
jgi:hypothetical protein